MSQLRQPRPSTPNLAMDPPSPQQTDQQHKFHPLLFPYPHDHLPFSLGTGLYVSPFSRPVDKNDHPQQPPHQPLFQTSSSIQHLTASAHQPPVATGSAQFANQAPGNAATAFISEARNPTPCGLYVPAFVGKETDRSAHKHNLLPVPHSSRGEGHSLFSPQPLSGTPLSGTPQKILNDPLQLPPASASQPDFERHGNMGSGDGPEIGTATSKDIQGISAASPKAENAIHGTMHAHASNASVALPELSQLSLPKREHSIVSPVPTLFPGASSSSYPLLSSTRLQETRNPAFSGSSAVQNNTQTPAQWITPPALYRNVAEVNVQPCSPSIAAGQSKELCYRGNLNSADIPLVQAHRTQQLPHTDAYHNMTPGFPVSSSHDANATIHPKVRKSAPSQSLPYEPAPRTRQSTIPPLGRPPAQKQSDLYRAPPLFSEGTSAAQGYENIQAHANLSNPFAVPSSRNGALTHYSSPAVSSTQKGARGAGATHPQPQRTQVSVQPNQNTEDRAKVIFHPKVEEVNGTICTKCNKVFKTEKDMQRHVQRMHIMKGRYPCPYIPCKQSFAEAHKLSRHVRTVHLMNRPYKCPQCDSAFGERGNMLQHLKKSHVGEGREPKRARKD